MCDHPGMAPTAEATAVDVGVVTYNTRDLSVRALRRLLDQPSGCRLRVLVRDNGSSDGTTEAIAREVPEAELDAGTTNVGFARGVNSLIRRCSAPWFLALNSDAWPQQGAIDRLVASGDEHPTAAAVAPRLERPDGTLEHSTHPFPSVAVAGLYATGAVRILGRQRLDRLLLEPAWAHDRSRPVDWAVGAALLMRRSALDDLGGFDERYFMYAEDLEWCWRAARKGWSIWFEPDARVVHVGNASGERTYGSQRTEAFWRNTYRFYRGEHGAVNTFAYRTLNTVAAAKAYVIGRTRRDGSAGYWAETVRAHLAPVNGRDGPPS